MIPKLQQLEEQVSTELESLAALSESEKREKNQDIKEMIKYYNGLTTTIEGRRNQLYSSSLQLFALFLTISGLLIALRDDLGDWLVVFLAFLVVQLLSVVFMILFYETQSGFRYPFLKLKEYGNQWKWFYYANEHVTSMSRRPVFPEKDPEKTLLPYFKGLVHFIQSYRSETLDSEIIANVQQLYLLQAHNYFKNKFYKQLTMIRMWSLVGSIVASILGLFYVALK